MGRKMEGQQIEAEKIQEVELVAVAASNSKDSGDDEICTGEVIENGAVILEENTNDAERSQGVELVAAAEAIPEDVSLQISNRLELLDVSDDESKDNSENDSKSEVDSKHDSKGTFVPPALKSDAACVKRLTRLLKFQPKSVKFLRRSNYVESEKGHGTCAKSSAGDTGFSKVSRSKINGFCLVLLVVAIGIAM